MKGPHLPTIQCACAEFEDSAAAVNKIYKSVDHDDDCIGKQ
jgi:hypothetical protein